MSDVTQILDRARQGDPRAVEELLPLVYDELRKLAAHKMAHEAGGHTLQPTALVHEAWLRLGGGEAPSFQNRAHFFGAAAEAMRRILVESARRKSRLKRGGDVEMLELDDSLHAAQAPPDEIEAVHEALDLLAAEEPIAAEVVKLRYFVGLPIPEVAAVLNIAPRTADRLWAFARVRLRQAIRNGSA